MILDLFSKRRKRERGETPDVYIYDDLPAALRTQIVHIIRDAVETAQGPDEKSIELYRDLHDLLAREFGVFELHPDAKAYRPDHRSALFNFFLQEKQVERAIDVVELAFKCIVLLIPEWHYCADRKISPRDAVDELNGRFREHGVGYQFESKQIIRVDSQYLHVEAVKPVLNLLSAQNFAGANDEFLRAHENYRHARHKEALADALKALESTLKTICERRHWSYDRTDTAKRLIEIVFENQLIPQTLQAQFASLRTTIESGIPTVRNKLAGHGQGTDPVVVPPYLAAYGLNIAAAAIRLLVEAHLS